jgi:hypothetical protein
VEGNAAISSPSWPADDKPPVGPRMGANRVRHLHSSDGLVNEQVESGSALAKPQYRGHAHIMCDKPCKVLAQESSMSRRSAPSVADAYATIHSSEKYAQAATQHKNTATAVEKVALRTVWILSLFGRPMSIRSEMHSLHVAELDLS